MKTGIKYINSKIAKGKLEYNQLEPEFKRNIDIFLFFVRKNGEY